MEIRCVYTEGNQNVIQEAVDRLPASGGTVIVPRGEWKSGAIHLKSNVKLYLEEGCVIHFSSCMEDYLPPVFTRWEGVECYNYSSLIYAADCENVTICGTGVLDGAGSAWWHWKKLQQNAADRLIRAESQGIVVEERVFATREDALRPSFIQFINCKHVTLEDFTIEDGPQWTIHPVYCEDVVVRGVTVNTKGPNTDGCNPDSCRKVLIEDCTFETGDDCIAINSGMNEDGWRVGRPCEQIEVKNCRFIGGHAAVAIGSGMYIIGIVTTVLLVILQLLLHRNNRVLKPFVSIHVTLSVKANQDPLELIHTLFPDKRVKIMDIEAHKTDAECEESDVKLTILVPNSYSSSDIMKIYQTTPYVKHIDF